MVMFCVVNGSVNLERWLEREKAYGLLTAFQNYFQLPFLALKNGSACVVNGAVILFHVL